MLLDNIIIGNHYIGKNHPVFVIAEAGVNHNGKPEIAKELIEVAIEAGANAVKFQTFNTDLIVTRKAAKAKYQLQNDDDSESQYDMLNRLEFSQEVIKNLNTFCQKRNIIFLSSPFESKSSDILEKLDVVAYKIPSGEITNLKFLAHVAHKRKPMIVSTGMSSLGEVETAINIIEKTGNNKIILLHCVSTYPADPSDANLKAMATMSSAFGFPVGFSDHTLGFEVSFAAVALGACIIEKHFTLNRNDSGPDHQASLEPEELKNFIQGIRRVEAALGNGRKKIAHSEKNTAEVSRKSLISVLTLTKGSVLTEKMIRIMRPGTGLPPNVLPHIIGRKLNRNVSAGTPISLDMLL